MDLTEAIKSRKSIRAYKPDPVPRETLMKVMEAARHAVSWGNSQPWEFAVLGGKQMEEVRETLYNKPDSGEGFAPDFPYSTFIEPFEHRVAQITEQIWEAFGAAPENESDTQRVMAIMRRNYDAPHMIVSYIDRSLDVFSLLDIGAAIQLILLEAHNAGLGCCVMAATAGYPDDLRRILGLPETKRIILGISLGYPDWDSPKNQWQRHKEPVEQYTSWFGFD